MNDRSYVERKRDGVKRCGTCNEEFSAVPGWNDHHVHVEIRGKASTSFQHGWFCSEACAAEWLREVYA